MTTLGYKFYLLVLIVSHKRAKHSKIKFVSPRGYVISSIYHLTNMQPTNQN